MAARTERGEARIAPVAEHHTTTVPAAFFDDLLAALDTPAAAKPALAEAAMTRNRTVTRR